MVKVQLHNESGHTLIEILTVAILISILATVPISYLREVKIRAHETAAIGALNQIAAAYEMYRVVAGRNRSYPHFFSNGTTNDVVTFHNAEEVWHTLIREKLLPRSYSLYSHDEPSLLASGYYFSIYPVDYGLPNRYSITPGESYAFALIPIPFSRQPRTLAVLHGEHFRHYYTNARIYKSTTKDGNLRNVQIFTFKDPERQ